MKIMVFDVPAEHGGALSILEEYYSMALNNEDKSIQWLFVVSKPQLKDAKNVKVLRYPWVKKSWFHRMFFDYFISPKLVKKHNVTEILSLQNITVPRIKNVRQSVYLHQSLPFADIKFKFFENRKLWVYQNIIGRLIIRSIKKADHVIVQTNWMKDSCIEKTNQPDSKFDVRPPQTGEIVVGRTFILNEETKKTFFYPAGASYYKNHRVIVEACKTLISNGINDFEVILTLNGDENQHIVDLKNTIVNFKLPIHFVGKIPRERVFDYYSKAILLFPSYIESSPLPLTEGKLHKTFIIASDCSFSKEILEDYDKSYLFNWSDSQRLAELINECISKRINGTNKEELN